MRLHTNFQPFPILEIEWGTFVDDVRNMASDLWDKMSGMFESDGS